MRKFVFEIDPMGYVRTTRYGKFAKSAQKYHHYMNVLRMLMTEQEFRVPEIYFQITFFLPIAAGKPEKTKQALENKPHRFRPDNDNLAKAFFDAYFYKGKLKEGTLMYRDELRNDSAIYDYRIRKFWARTGRIEVEVYQ